MDEMPKFTIHDSIHAKGGVTLEADTPRAALKRYAETECHDAGDGDEVNVELHDEKGNRWIGTADLEEVRQWDVSVRLIPKAKAES